MKALELSKPDLSPPLDLAVGAGKFVRHGQTAAFRPALKAGGEEQTLLGGAAVDDRL